MFMDGSPQERGLRFQILVKVSILIAMSVIKVSILVVGECSDY
jgi:hypothetical protein